MNNLLHKFIDSGNGEFAFLLHGEWGSGKTYYLKNNLLESIPKEKNKYYVSLFGVSNIEQIYSQLLTQKILKNKSGKFLRISTSLLTAAISGISNHIKDASKVNSDDLGFKAIDLIPIDNCVIIFDDLERYSKNADISELLGQIHSYFIAEETIKVIFVADEDKIDAEIYKSYKEKIIGLQAKLEIDFKQTVTSIITKNKNTELRKFLLEHIDFIIEMCNSFELKNLRTINYYIEILSVVFIKEISDFASKEDFLYSIFAMTLEEKTNRLSDIKKPKDIPAYIARTIGSEMITMSNHKLEGHFNKYIISDFRTKRNYRFNYYYYSEIFELIRFGTLRETLIKKEIYEVENFKKKNQKSHLIKLIEKLRGYFHMSNEKFTDTYSNFLELLEKQDEVFKFDEIVMICELIYYLQKQPQLNVRAAIVIEKYVRWRIEKLTDIDIFNYTQIELNEIDRAIGQINRYDGDFSRELDEILKELKFTFIKEQTKNRIGKSKFSEISHYDLRLFLSTAKPAEVIKIINQIRQKDGKLEEFTTQIEKAFKIPLSSFDKITRESEIKRLITLKEELLSFQKGLKLIENIWIEEMIKAIKTEIEKNKTIEKNIYNK